jgi:hypothetical protein
LLIRGQENHLVVRTAIVIAGAVAALLLAGCSHTRSHTTAVKAHVVQPNAPWRNVINDWFRDGRIDHRYSCATLGAAVAHLPRDGPQTGAPIRVYERKVCRRRDADPNHSGTTVAFGTSSQYPVLIAAGVQPRMSPSAVAAIVLQQLGPDASIDRMNLLADEGSLPSVEPNAGSPNPNLPHVGPVWVVRAHGAFVSTLGPPRTADVHSTTGYYEINDNTGEILGMGMP